MTTNSQAAQDQTLVQSGQARTFWQEDGISPLNPYIYYGAIQIDKSTVDLGKVTPIYAPVPTQRNRWKIVDNIKDAPALGKSGFMAHMDRYLRDIWWKIKERGCFTNLQVVTGECQRPDQMQGDGRLLFKYVNVESFDISELNVLEGSKNGPVDVTGTFTFQDMVALRSIMFESRGAATLLSEIVDAVWYDVPQCGSCGTASDGCQKLYMLSIANAGSPGLSSQIYFSRDSGVTFTAVDIPTLAGLSGNRLAAMGDKLIVISQASGSHHWAYIQDILNSLPNWTAVSTGYVSTKGPRCIYERNVNQAWIGGAGGYIYYMTDPTQAVTVATDNSNTSQDVNDIHGIGRTVVAVGNSNTVQFSQNEGGSFALLTGPAVGQNLTTIWCQSQLIWFVGTNNGKLYITTDAGTTWTQINFGTAQVINDIQFQDEVVGYMAVEVNGAARVYRTLDSGYSWQYQAPTISGLPTTWARMNVVVPCGWNMVVAAGRVTSGGIGACGIAVSRPV